MQIVWYAVRFNEFNLCENQIFGAAAVQTQDEADGLEQLLDAGSERLLLHPTGGSCIQDSRLHNELEQVLQSLIVDR